MTEAAETKEPGNMEIHYNVTGPYKKGLTAEGNYSIGRKGTLTGEENKESYRQNFQEYFRRKECFSKRIAIEYQTEIFHCCSMEMNMVKYYSRHQTVPARENTWKSY